MMTININNENREVTVVRYFTYNDHRYLLYTLNEIDENGYQRLYICKETQIEQDGRTIADNIVDEAEWGELKELIKVIIKENREGNLVSITDLDYKKLNQVYILGTRIFKLNSGLVEVLGSNKKEFFEEVAIEQPEVPVVPEESTTIETTPEITPAPIFEPMFPSVEPEVEAVPDVEPIVPTPESEVSETGNEIPPVEINNEQPYGEIASNFGDHYNLTATDEELNALINPFDNNIQNLPQLEPLSLDQVPDEKGLEEDINYETQYAALVEEIDRLKAEMAVYKTKFEEINRIIQE